MIKVRFAPSPTGFLHIGSVRTALFNYLLARNQGGKLILRVEDTDRSRSEDRFLREIVEDLPWLGLDWDDGPYFQMERLEIYRRHAQTLLEKNLAYPCFCTAQELEATREKAAEEKRAPAYPGTCADCSPSEAQKLMAEGRPYTLRFRVPKGETLIDDAIRGEVRFDNSLLDDFIIVKSDGIPVYNFAAVVDDYLMEITHVIRGEEHLSNTPRQVLIYQGLGQTPPKFVHIPIILDEQKRKLSKRRGGVELPDFIKRGFLPEAVFNFLALLGWAPGDNREVMTREELIAAFSLEKVSRHPAVFDEQKLLWMNALYIKELGAAKLAQRALPFYQRAGFNPPEDFLEKVCGLYLERVRTLEELVESTDFFFTEVKTYDEKAAAKHAEKPEIFSQLSTLAQKLEQLTPFTAPEIESTVRETAEAMGISAGKLIHPSRLALTGRGVSAGLFEIIELLGQEKTAQRLKELKNNLHKAGLNA